MHIKLIVNCHLCISNCPKIVFNLPLCKGKGNVEKEGLSPCFWEKYTVTKPFQTNMIKYTLKS